MHENFRSAQLTELGFIGSDQDKWKQWLASEGFTGSTADAELAWLVDQGFDTGSLNDRYFRLYRESGLTGTLDDMGQQWQIPATPDGLRTFTVEEFDDGIGARNIGVSPYTTIESLYQHDATMIRITGTAGDYADGTIPFTTIWLNDVPGSYVSHTIEDGIVYAIYDIPIVLGGTYNMYFSVA